MAEKTVQIYGEIKLPKKLTEKEFEEIRKKAEQKEERKTNDKDKEAYLKRLETDAIGKPIDITKVKWKAKPLTAEELKKIKEEQRKKKLAKKK